MIEGFEPIRQLGVHEAIQPVDAPAGLPAFTHYVERPHDAHLRSLLSGGRQNRLLLVTGGSWTGKTRACYEALRAVLPDSPVELPADDNELLAMLEAGLPPGAIVWLDDAQRFLRGRQGCDVARALQLMLDTPAGTEAGRVVIGSMRADEIWRPADDDCGQAIYELLGRPGIVIPVHESFPARERVEHAAKLDPRWRAALLAADGAHIVPYFGGGPSLVLRYTEGRYRRGAHALLTAAMDARRIGFWSPLSPAQLAEACGGYLPAELSRISLDQALSEATQQIDGVSALVGAGGRDDAFVLHGCLAEHGYCARRREPIPDSLWRAITDGVVDSGDIERAVESALTMGVTRWALPLLRRQAARGDHVASRRLAGLLDASDDPSAVEELRDRALGGSWDAVDRLIGRSDPIAVQLLASRARDGDPDAAGRLVELLFQRGGPEAEAQLRLLADSGAVDAARRLDELLFVRGDADALAELRSRAARGDFHAAAVLAELLAGWCDPEALAELRTRAADGDGAAATRLVEVLAERGHPDDVAELRARAGHGDAYAAEMLDLLLRERARACVPTAELVAERGDGDAVVQLRQLAEAGDSYATEADGGGHYAGRRLVDVLSERQDPAATVELRTRARDGDRCAAERLVELLAVQGGEVAVGELRGLADHGNHRAAQVLAWLLLRRIDERGLQAEANAANTGDAARALTVIHQRSGTRA